MTWCITETVFSQAACQWQTLRWGNSNILNSRLSKSWSLADLQVFGMMVSPGQQHGGKQVSRPHKHSVHFWDVHADFVIGFAPIWLDYEDDTQLSCARGMRQICVLSPRRQLDWPTCVLAAQGHQEPVPLLWGKVCTREDNSFRTHFMKQVHHLKEQKGGFFFKLSVLTNLISHTHMNTCLDSILPCLDFPPC